MYNYSELTWFLSQQELFNKYEEVTTEATFSSLNNEPHSEKKEAINNDHPWKRINVKTS